MSYYQSIPENAPTAVENRDTHLMSEITGDIARDLDAQKEAVGIIEDMDSQLKE